MCPSLGTQVFHCLEVPIKIGTSAFNCIFSSVCAMQFTHNNVLNSLKLGLSHYWRLNQTHQKRGLERISGLIELVPSSTLVLDKAPICIDDTLSPAQNRENTPPEMGC